MNIGRTFNRGVAATAVAAVLMGSTAMVAADGAAEDGGSATFFGIPVDTSGDGKSLEQRRQEARQANAERGLEGRSDRPGQPAERALPSLEEDDADTEESSEPTEPEGVIWRTGGDVPENMMLPEPYQSRRRARGASLVRLSTTLRQVYQCQMCRGKGEVTRREKVGQRQRGNLVSDVYEDVTSTCGRCEGDGYGPGQAINRLLANLTAQLAALPPEDPNAAETLDRIHGTLVRMLNKDADPLAERLNPASVDALRGTLRSGRIGGTPLAGLGEVAAVGKLAGTELLVVAVAMEDATVILSDMKFANEPTVGEMMLFGGVIGAFVQDSAQALPILQNGYLVRPNVDAESIVDGEGFLKPDHREIAALQEVEVLPQVEQATELDEQESVAIESFEQFLSLVPDNLKDGDDQEEIGEVLRAWAQDALHLRRVDIPGGTVSEFDERVEVEDGVRTDYGRFRVHKAYTARGWVLVLEGRSSAELDEARGIAEEIANGAAWSGAVRSIDFTTSAWPTYGIERGTPTLWLTLNNISAASE